jgi:hypothetical protein
MTISVENVARVEWAYLQCEDLDIRVPMGEAFEESCYRVLRTIVENVNTYQYQRARNRQQRTVWISAIAKCHQMDWTESCDEDN